MRRITFLVFIYASRDYLYAPCISVIPHEANRSVRTLLKCLVNVSLSLARVVRSFVMFFHLLTTCFHVHVVSLLGNDKMLAKALAMRNISAFDVMSAKCT